MKPPSTQAEFDAYLAAGGADFINGGAFRKRWEELQRRAPGRMTVAASAAFVGLPVNVFRHYLATLQAIECIEMGEPSSGSVN